MNNRGVGALMRDLVALLIVAIAGTAHAALVTTTQSIRIDFTLPVVSPFDLPAVILDHTVSFSRTNPLNIGEAYEVSSFDAFGTLLGLDSYTNSIASQIIGCACTGGLLDQPLATDSGYLVIVATSGSFDVLGVNVVAYDLPNGLGDSSSAVGTIRAVAEPGTLALLALGLAGLAYSRRKQ